MRSNGLSRLSKAKVYLFACYTIILLNFGKMFWEEKKEKKKHFIASVQFDI